MEPVRGSDKRPTDGAPYSVKEGYWYCDLCWLYAWGDHMTSAKHLRRLADYFDEQEDLRQMHTIVGQAALPAPFKGPPPTPPESISSHAGSASGAAASAATPTVGPSTAAASAKMPPPPSPYVGPAEPWMPCMAAPPPPRLPIAQGSATISAAQPAAGSGSAGSPQIPGPAIGIAASVTGGLEARLTEMEGRLQEHIGSLHAAVQECHSMIATVQMMQTMVQSSGRNLH